MEFPGNIWPLP